MYIVVVTLLSRLSDLILEGSDQNNLLSMKYNKINARSSYINHTYTYTYIHTHTHSHTHTHTCTHRLKGSTAMPRGDPAVFAIYSTVPDNSFSFPILLLLSTPTQVFKTSAMHYLVTTYLSSLQYKESEIQSYANAQAYTLSLVTS